jgi:hypothetical protein
MSVVEAYNRQKLSQKLFLNMCLWFLMINFYVTPSINTNDEKESNIGQEVSNQRPNKVFYMCW